MQRRSFIASLFTAVAAVVVPKGKVLGESKERTPRELAEYIIDRQRGIVTFRIMHPDKSRSNCVRCVRYCYEHGFNATG